MTIRLYTKDSLQDALFEALDNNSSPAEFVKKYVTNLGKLIAKKPAYYRYLGPYWWPIKALMLRHEVPGIDDFIDQEGLAKINFPGDEYVCVAAWAMQESRIAAMELPTNSVLIEDADGNVTECVVIDPFLEQKNKSG
jgi:hypothetical protein